MSREYDFEYGTYERTVAVFDYHSTLSGPRSLSIVREEEKLRAYVGPYKPGLIDYWEADTIEEWEQVSSPALAIDGIRWPSVLKRNGVYYMMSEQHRPIHLQRYLGSAIVTNESLFALDRVWRYLTKPPKTSLSLYTSTDGLNFSRYSTIIPFGEKDRRYHQNPYLFETRSGSVQLLYYGGDGERWGIYRREASSPKDLSSAEDQLIVHADRTIAAPAAFYHPHTGAIVLFTEELDGSDLTTTVRIGDDWDDFDADDFDLLFSNNANCASPFLHDDRLYVFKCKQLRAGLSPLMRGELLEYSIEG
jgi:hypothetical protein